MARDITTSVRLEEMLDKFLTHIAKNDRRAKASLKFLTHIAKNDRRAKASLFAIIIEDFAKDHDYLEWLEENSKLRIPNKPVD